METHSFLRGLITPLYKSSLPFLTICHSSKKIDSFTINQLIKIDDSRIDYSGENVYIAPFPPKDKLFWANLRGGSFYTEGLMIRSYHGRDSLTNAFSNNLDTVNMKFYPFMVGRTLEDKVLISL